MSVMIAGRLHDVAVVATDGIRHQLVGNNRMAETASANRARNATDNRGLAFGAESRRFYF